MSKQVQKSERQSRAKTATSVDQKRRGSRSRSVTRQKECRNGPECVDLRSLGGCSFGHTKEDADRTKCFRACVHGLMCSYITENLDDCKFNHGTFQRLSVPVLAEPECAKVEEVRDVVAPSVGPKKTNKKSTPHTRT